MYLLLEMFFICDKVFKLYLGKWCLGLVLKNKIFYNFYLRICSFYMLLYIWIVNWSKVLDRIWIYLMS